MESNGWVMWNMGTFNDPCWDEKTSAGCWRWRFLGATRGRYQALCVLLDRAQGSQLAAVKKLDGKISEFEMGLSENSVALNPMVNDHYPY